MKTYRGERTAEGCVVKVESVDRLGRRQVHPLPLRLDLWNHSPSGFEWGYGGSGPAQLALAILADHLGDDEKASRLHQPFKWEAIVGLDHEGWTLTSEQVQTIVEQLELKRLPSPVRTAGPER